MSGAAGIEDRLSQEEMAIHVALRTERLDSAAIEQIIESPANGAQCVFRGVVRRDSDLNPVESLEYEAYSEMATRQLQDMAVTPATSGREPGLRWSIGWDRFRSVNRAS